MSRFDVADPSLDADRCDSLSLNPDEERADEARELADIAEADAALIPQTRKGAA